MDGRTGKIGAKGFTGLRGNYGFSGQQGTEGIKGNPGKSGRDGIKGKKVFLLIYIDVPYHELWLFPTIIHTYSNGLKHHDHPINTRV